MRRIPTSLQRLQTELAELLHLPENLGIHLHQVSPRPHGEPRALAVFIQGLADAERVRLWVLEPLRDLPETDGGPGALQTFLAAPDCRRVADLNEAVAGVARGATALFVQGAAEALVIGTAGSAVDQAAGEHFGPALTGNIASIRARLRTPALVAETTAAGSETSALVYLKGRAEPDLITRVRKWVREQGSDEALRRGAAGGRAGRSGQLPDLMSTEWPGKTATLLDAGYVAVLVDRVPFAFIAPVTAAALLQGPSDEYQRRRMVGLRRFLRVLVAFAVMLSAAMTVAVLEYHHELVPTPFLMALAAVRETAPLPVIMYVLVQEFVQEILLILPSRLQVHVATGQIVIAYVLIITFLAFIGMTGPLPALGGIIGFLGTVSLSSSDLRHLIRAWRWAAVVGAAVFGLFGTTTVVFMLAAYLTQHESFGVPFLGETGSKFTTAGLSSAGAGREDGDAGWSAANR